MTLHHMTGIPPRGMRSSIAISDAMVRVMRTTINLPEDLHQQTKGLARDLGQSLSETIAMLLRRAMGHDHAPEVTTDAASGLPTVTLGRPVSAEDVRSLDDE
jgi:hypothetical protein